MYRFFSLLLILMLFSLFASCSKGGSGNKMVNDLNNPLIPIADYEDDSGSGRVMLGQWKVTIDPITKTATAVQTRACMDHAVTDLSLVPVFPEELWPEMWVDKSCVWNFDMYLLRTDPDYSHLSYSNIRAILEPTPTSGMQVLGLHNLMAQPLYGLTRNLNDNSRLFTMMICPIPSLNKTFRF